MFISGKNCFSIIHTEISFSVLGINKHVYRYSACSSKPPSLSNGVRYDYKRKKSFNILDSNRSAKNISVIGSILYNVGHNGLRFEMYFSIFYV